MNRLTMKHFALLLAAVVAVGMVAGTLYRGEPVRERRVSTRAGTSPEVRRLAEQHAGSRRWRVVHHHLLYAVQAGPDGPLVTPLLARADAQGNVLVLDWAERKIKKFDNRGQLVTVFGEGSGGGGGEFTNLTDFDIGSDGSVWACDPLGGRVTVFGPSGEVRRSFRPDRPPYRIALLPPGGCVIMSSPIGNKLLTVLADDGTLLRRSGTFLEDQERLGIVLDGRLVATPDGRVAYAAYRSGMLLVYDAEKDTLAAARETVEQGGFPDVVFRPTPGGELARVDPASPILTRSISAVGGELHLLAGITPAEGGRVFDVYDARDARYLYSYRFAGEAASACVTPGRVVAVSDSVVSVWGAER